MIEDKEKQLVKKIVEKYGADLFDLDKCRAIQKKCLDDVKRVKNEVCEMSNPDPQVFIIIVNMFQLSLSNSDSEVAKTIGRLKQTEELVKSTAPRVKHLEDKVGEHLKETCESSTTLENYFRKLNELECTLQYYQVVVRIENLR